MTVHAYDFKGQPLSKARKVLKDTVILSTMPTGAYRVDWGTTTESDLEGDYRTDMAYDALGRPVSITLPADVTSGRKEVTPTYNRSGAMESISLDNDVYVARIAYNARGQKVLVAYGNDLMTRYAYDPVNFRLLRQKTEGFTLSTLAYAPASGTTKYDSAYEYDLAGNIVSITDATTNCGVGGSGGTTPDELVRDFGYDALYRLVMATGRHSGAFGATGTPWDETGHVPDNTATGTEAYTRTYKYDRLGNMLDLYHDGGSGNQFHRYFNDFDTAPTAAFQTGNLATKVKYGGTSVNYTFDDNGNMLTEGAGRSFEWDFGDRLRWFEEGTTTAAYLYDAGGKRVKKLVRNGSGNSVVTVYIDGGFEHLYKLSSSSVVSEEHNELHVMDGRSRIATKRVGTAFSGDGSPATKYVLEDHLGNSSVTVDASNSSLITREEYFPFGETSFGSYAKKRYRFCGKERDEESGLYYYGARYYAAWSCRFVSIDPLAGKMPFFSPYSYAANSPVCLEDVDGLAPGGGGGGGQPQATMKTQPQDETRTASPNRDVTRISNPNKADIIAKNMGWGSPEAPSYSPPTKAADVTGLGVGTYELKVSDGTLEQPTANGASNRTRGFLEGAVLGFANRVGEIGASAINGDLIPSIALTKATYNCISDCSIDPFVNWIGGQLMAVASPLTAIEKGKNVFEDVLDGKGYKVGWAWGGNLADGVSFLMMEGVSKGMSTNGSAVEIGQPVLSNLSEIYYRTMNAKSAEVFVQTGKMPPGSETMVSPTLSFAQGYTGVTFEIEIAAGTMEQLKNIGVRNIAVGHPYAEMPLVERGWKATNAFFKYEGGQVNIGLGNGSALDIFNQGIQRYNIMQ